MFESKVDRKQKYLGDKLLIVLIAFYSAFVPLSTDIYLPALPTMTIAFNTPTVLINLTLICFFVFYSLGILFWGPLSDKYGRKPILLTGLTIYTIASILCSFSINVYQLICFRILQAIGGGSVTSVAMAIVKDVYGTEKREAVLALVQSMVMVAPIIAPLIGAMVLNYISWRGVFWVLALLGFLGLLGALAYQETIHQYYKGNMLQSFKILKIVLKNKSFASLLFTFSMITMPLLAFISASSYIYINGFGLSEQKYSYFFAANACFSVLGPLSYVKLSKYFYIDSIIKRSYIIIIVSGIAISILGNLSPWFFAITLIPATFLSSLLRPISANLILEQEGQYTGTASSLIGCIMTLSGSIGMMLISLNWPNRIIVLGLTYIVIAFISLMLWTKISRKDYIKRVPNLFPKDR